VQGRHDTDSEGECQRDRRVTARAAKRPPLGGSGLRVGMLRRLPAASATPPGCRRPWTRA
jgi:hypothetical protein